MTLLDRIMRRNRIGQLASRRGRDVWHLVESEVADRFVTRCGHEMHLKDARGRELEFSDPELIAPDLRCQRCA